jgi:HEAT repeat protein
MTIRMCVLVAVCAAVSVSAANAPVPARVRELFAKADELTALRPKMSREYLSSLSNEQLTELYRKAMAAQYQSPTARKDALAKDWSQRIAQDRQGVITELVTDHLAPLDERREKDLQAQREEIDRELAGLGPAAVPAILSNMGGRDLQANRWGTAQAALLRMGPVAVEPLLPFMKSDDVILRDNVADVLGQLGDPRTKDVLIAALADESGNTRRYALQGLVKLGPREMGPGKLNKLLIDRLQDEACLQDAINGLEQYGDETAIEPLRVVKRFDPGVGKAGYRSYAAGAIDAILKRAGKPPEQIEPNSDTQPDYDAILAAASCPNAAIRTRAIARLESYTDDRTARFFVERLNQESGPMLRRLVHSFTHLVTMSKRTQMVSPAIVHDAFDRLMSGVQAPPDRDRKMDAMRSAGAVLLAGSRCQMPLKGADAYKRIILDGIASNTEDARIAEYSGCIASVALIRPPTGESWSAAEKEDLQRRMMPLLDRPNPDQGIIVCLGYIADNRVTAKLVAILDHNDPTTRATAAQSLGEIGDAQALPRLQQLSQSDPYCVADGVYPVRQFAQQAITRITESRKR